MRLRLAFCSHAGPHAESSSKHHTGHVTIFWNSMCGGEIGGPLGFCFMVGNLYFPPGCFSPLYLGDENRVQLTVLWACLLVWPGMMAPHRCLFRSPTPCSASCVLTYPIVISVLHLLALVRWAPGCAMWSVHSLTTCLRFWWQLYSVCFSIRIFEKWGSVYRAANQVLF